jgi:hypothetical protein
MQEQQLQQQQQIEQARLQEKQMEMQMQDMLNQRDNETKVLIATIQAEARVRDDNDGDGINPEYSPEAKEKLLESMRQFDAKLQLERDKFNFDKKKHEDDIAVKKQQIASRPKTTTKK